MRSRRDSPCPCSNLRAMSCLHHLKCCCPSLLSRPMAGPSSARFLPMPKATLQRYVRALPAPACIPARLCFPRVGLGQIHASIRPFLPAAFPSSHQTGILCKVGVPAFRSLLNITSRNIEQDSLQDRRCGTPLLPHLQVQHNPLTTTLRASLCSQFLPI